MKATTPINVGERFGRLLVTGLSKERKNHSLVWECICDCGNIKEVPSHHLRRKHTSSCGCLLTETGIKNLEKAKGWNKLPKGVAAFNSLIKQYSIQASIRGLAWKLSKEECLSLFTSNCFYCGTPPNTTIGREFYNGSFTYNGIDRKNNLIGYVLDNCVSCCGFCNRKKSDTNFEEFITWIRTIYKNLSNAEEMTGEVRANG